MAERNSSDPTAQRKKDANVCMALGAGVGVFGGAAALVSGALCPLCLVVTPGLIGYGAYQRYKASGSEQMESESAAKIVEDVK
jgi:uncharacterized membrane protein YebE (DUF533 family)